MTQTGLKERAMAAFDAANGEDPNLIEVDGEMRARELVHAERVSGWVNKLMPNASEGLQLAARCQHICRWQVPRSSQPMNRAGYLKWREGLKSFHAEKSAEILRDLGYADEVIERVKSLNQKKNIKGDEECQVLEDALCLVFLEFQFANLIADTEHGKMIKIVQKTWAKMGERGQQAALTLTYSDAEMAVLKEALGL
ncbi:DUF4202 domain-containing protein [Persicirhabdus sediminis]|uniref:DUF4202 domain-containing protein n=1 Tax=Persicirhabdus sediminis TaxID=454144 RepID=A0A8J7MCP0_9BACT|nr:DUF4202 domain-containing protein [Persicirhabdus sediminis]MBK1790703.1 DUF4202 domain-containing protein [Persicirhabdus sediminis]